MTLTKHAAAKKIESELKFNKQKAIETVESLLELIKSTLESGEDVLISGFGKFCVRDKKNAKVVILPQVKLQSFQPDGS